jgi:hypothetical protein
VSKDAKSQDPPSGITIPIPPAASQPLQSNSAETESVSADNSAAENETSSAESVPRNPQEVPPPVSEESAGRAKQSYESKKRARPESISELFEYAYGEAGRKLNLARDLTDITVNPEASQSEIDLVLRLSAADSFLVVPPHLLAATAEIDTRSRVRERILQLTLVALANHKLFEAAAERLVDPKAEPPLTAREVSSIAKTFTFAPADAEQAPERRTALRERVRINAVTTFVLLRVLRDGWTTEQFIQDMSALVWDSPLQRSAPRMAALLATAKNSDALSQLSRHFESQLIDAKTQTSAAIRRANELEHRASSAEAEAQAVMAEVAAGRSRLADLQMQIHQLDKELDTERSNRLVDKSHLVDDYEALRTQIIRRLSAQVDLLGDALDAIRIGEAAVAEEFVDRALRKIDGEVTRLRELDEGEK